MLRCFIQIHLMKIDWFCFHIYNYSSVLNDFPLARAVFRNNPLIGRIHDVLLLSQKGLVTDPGQLIPQMLGRLAEDDVRKYWFLSHFIIIMIRHKKVPGFLWTDILVIDFFGPSRYFFLSIFFLHLRTKKTILPTDRPYNLMASKGPGFCFIS